VGQKKTLLFIGRVHPKKGLELLIEALFKLKEKNSGFLKNWNIQIIGWDQENHLNDLRSKCSVYNLQKNITFIGPLFGEEKELKLKSADAFILPSYSEGLPMSILEAWSYKLPVLMTNECNLPEGFATGSAIELKLDSEQIAIELEKMNNLNEIQLREIGVNGFELVKQEFTWDKIALDMENTYNWLLTKKDKPNFVNLK
jgi:poly(glycerol-phosphate) alpha-glucosyltransferase